MEESMVSDKDNGVHGSGHEISPEPVPSLSAGTLGCEGQQALVTDDVSSLRLGVQLNTALDVPPGCQSPKNEVNGGVTWVSPPTSSIVPEPIVLGVTPGETVKRKRGKPPGFKSPKNEVNGAVTCVSAHTSSVPPEPTPIGVILGEVMKRKRGRPKLPKKNVNGALPLESSPPSNTALMPIGTELPSGETVKRKRGRTWGKGINGTKPLSSTSTAKALNTTNMPPGELLKRKPGRPGKVRVDGAIPGVASSLTISSPLGTERPSGEPVKKKRGRPWKRGINGVLPTISSPSTALPATATAPVKRKAGRPWKRRSIGAMSMKSSPVTSPAPIAMGVPSSPTTAPARIAMEMPLRELVKRKAGRPPKRVIGGAVSRNPSRTSAGALTPIQSMRSGLPPRTETMQQSTSHGVSEPSSRDGKGAQPQTRLLENVSDVDLCQSLPLAATATETHTQESLPLRFPYVNPSLANLDSFGMGTTVGSADSRDMCVTVPNASCEQGETGRSTVEETAVAVTNNSTWLTHVTDQSQNTPGVIPIPVEYEHIYKEIEDRHGRLDNGESIGQNDTLSYATLVELMSVVHQLKNLAMESVTEGMIASFERTVTIGRLFNFNVEWLRENLKRLRGQYEKRCAIDVVTLEQDVQRCDTWLKCTQDELSRMEAAYMAAKKKVDDLIKNRDEAKAKLAAARHQLEFSEKFQFVI